MRVRKTDASGQGGTNTRELTALLGFFGFFFSLAELKFVAFWAEKITFILVGRPLLKV